jgi:MerR HTH family regulatory protein
MTMSNNQFSIHDAAQASGLTPSVIRVWEERYGWPSPKRHRNGYRAFAAHEIDELKRAAALVKGGMPIGKLIIDGFPKWPEDEVHVAPKHYDLAFTSSLPTRPGRTADDLRAIVLEGLKQAHGGRVLEAVQRACIELRPSDELTVVLAPALIGITELNQHDRVLNHEREVRQAVATRCRQLRNRMPTTGREVLIAPGRETDAEFTALVISALAARGINARQSARAEANLIASENVPSPGERTHIHITALPCEGCVPLVHILDTKQAAHQLLQLPVSSALAS